jgi:CHASE2 domain-containing sensor protein
MRFWTIGTFIIAFAAVTTYAGLLTRFLIFRQPLYWTFVVAAAAAAAAVLLVHEWWLRRQ